jgi:hypothetical protein
MIGAVHSWRDDASEQAQGDLDALLNAALPHAKQLLIADGRFFPYAVGISLAGDLAMRATYSGDRRRPRAAEMLEWLYQDARRDADRLRAVTFVADVRSAGKDAIGFQLQHRDRISIGVLVPYLRSRFHQAVSLGPMRATEGVPRVWTDADRSDLPSS